MDKLTVLKNLIKSIVTTELNPNDKVVANSFTLNPISLVIGLKGDGHVQESVQRYELDFFFNQKGEVMAKAIALQDALKEYAIGDLYLTWEQNVLLWRGTFAIEII